MRNSLIHYSVVPKTNKDLNSIREHRKLLLDTEVLQMMNITQEFWYLFKNSFNILVFKNSKMFTIVFMVKKWSVLCGTKYLKHWL